MDLINLSVSKYDYLNQLAGSKIDHININKCFSKYFDVKVHNLSEGEYLTKEDFVNGFLGRCSYLLFEQNYNSSIVFYFSGHGYIKDNELYLSLSDDGIEIKDIVNELIKLRRPIVIILDCCCAGYVETMSNIVSNLQEAFNKENISYYCACRGDENAYESDGGKFTNIFIESIEDVFSTRLSYTRNQFINLLRKKTQFLDNQHFEFKCFNNDNPLIKSIFVPSYDVRSVNYQTDNLLLKEIVPIHNKFKRYRIRCVYNPELNEEGLVEEFLKLLEEADDFEVYNDYNQEQKLKETKLTHLFAFFYPNEDSYNYKIHMYTIDWVRPSANREAFYNKNSQLILDCKIERNTFYDSQMKIISSN